MIEKRKMKKNDIRANAQNRVELTCNSYPKSTFLIRRELIPPKISLLDRVRKK